MTRVDHKQRRAALRDELYARVDAGDLTLVEAVKRMRKIAGRSQAEYARLVGVSHACSSSSSAGSAIRP